LAIEIGVDARRINEITLGTRSVTADTALRLGRYFGVSPQFWLGLQAEYDLDMAMTILATGLIVRSGLAHLRQLLKAVKQAHTAINLTYAIFNLELEGK